MKKTGRDIVRKRGMQDNKDKNKKKDHSSNNYLAVGLSLGVAFGLLLDDPALGIACGVIVGCLPNFKNRGKK